MRRASESHRCLSSLFVVQCDQSCRWGGSAPFVPVALLLCSRNVFLARQGVDFLHIPASSITTHTPHFWPTIMCTLTCYIGGRVPYRE